MTDQRYEFRSLALKDRLPLIIAKVICAVLLTWYCYLCVDSDDKAQRMQLLSLVLSLTFLYANLSNIKHELQQLVQPPIFLIGYPMATLSTIAYFWSIYI